MGLCRAFEALEAVAYEGGPSPPRAAPRQNSRAAVAFAVPHLAGRGVRRRQQTASSPWLPAAGRQTTYDLHSLTGFEAQENAKYNKELERERNKEHRELTHKRKREAQVLQQKARQKARLESASWRKHELQTLELVSAQARGGQATVFRGLSHGNWVAAKYYGGVALARGTGAASGGDSNMDEAEARNNNKTYAPPAVPALPALAARRVRICDRTEQMRNKQRPEDLLAYVFGVVGCTCVGARAGF